MGHPFLETPHLDSHRQAHGVHLKNAFVTTSLCSPSRASILTGLYTHKHRVIDNNRLVPAGTRLLPRSTCSRRATRRPSSASGTWAATADDPRPGFDHWVSFRGQGHYLPPSPDYTLNVDGARVPQKGYITDELTDYAVDWLKQQKPAEQTLLPLPLPQGRPRQLHPGGAPRGPLRGRALRAARQRRSRRARLPQPAPLAARPAQQLARSRLPLPQRPRHRELLQALLRDAARRGRQRRPRPGPARGDGRARRHPGHLHGRQRLHVRRARARSTSGSPTRPRSGCRC